MPTEKPFIRVGDTLPDISLPLTNGQNIRLRDYLGRRLFVFMWASW
jgi:peroxiredoxin